MRIKIASRKSDLARIQAYSVGTALKEKNPEIEIEYEFRESLGDKNLNDPLWKMPEKGVFTEDFVEDLKSGRADLVVHSWKDLPVENRHQTYIAATMPRADQRDLLLFRKDKYDEVKTSGVLKIFSSSPRRAYNLEPFFKVAMPFPVKNVTFKPVRGNVPTRIKKLFESENHGLIVAKAALDRLLLVDREEFLSVQKTLRDYLQKSLVMVTPLEKNPTAAAQGALAVEIKEGRTELVQLLKGIHCPRTFSAVSEEREKLKKFGGGCHQKVGVSVRNFSYGKLTITRAFTDKTGAVDAIEFTSSFKHPDADQDKIFPQSPNDLKFFDREYLKVDLPRGPLFISKADALPHDTHLLPSQVVWVSGFETWKKLAQRGVWITGCSESLGEPLDSNLEAIMGPLNFTKLSHVDAPHSENFLGTYKLISRENIPNLKLKTHFYWASGTSFKLAMERFPEIQTAYHACGPGHTFQAISDALKGIQEAKQVLVYPSLQIWRDRYSHGPERREGISK